MCHTKRIRYLCAVLIAAVAVSLMPSGCRTTGGGEKSETYSEKREEPRQTVIKEKTIVKEKEEERTILGAAFRLIGEVVAFPFEVLGMVFDKVL